MTNKEDFNIAENMLNNIENSTENSAASPLSKEAQEEIERIINDAVTKAMMTPVKRRTSQENNESTDNSSENEPIEQAYAYRNMQTQSDYVSTPTSYTSNDSITYAVDLSLIAAENKVERDLRKENKKSFKETLNEKIEDAKDKISEAKIPRRKDLFGSEISDLIDIDEIGKDSINKDKTKHAIFTKKTSDDLGIDKKDKKKKLSLSGLSKKKKDVASFVDENTGIKSKKKLTLIKKKDKNSADGGDDNQPPVKKAKRPKASKLTFAMSILMVFILFICLCGVIGAGVFAYKLCEDMPDMKAEDLKSPDSSVIYDNDGNKIMEIGMYLRENIEYEEMPNSLIDAFLAIEDSRYFTHIGFDIPRFTKAIIANLQSGDFGQGGSTITMQLIKNTYFSIDADSDSTIASREGMSGIKRKMQEIVLSIKTYFMDDLDKRTIMALYINKVNYGDNIRGVEKAAEYYFGKRASDLTLGESAFLAGLINSPSSYNPYNDLYKNDSIYLDPDSEYLQNAQARRDEVLDLMVYHGYITEAEAEIEKSVRIEDQLKGVSENFQYTNESYQWYIDAVIDEVIESTGESPYSVGMDIYTNMNSYMQKYIYDMQNEAEYTGIEFPNELCQSAIVLMNNQTGAIEALGGGRGEVDSARQFNRATSAYLNPGSSIKPIIDYALAIEYLGWATSHTITDMPYYLYDGPVLISNYDHTYYGDMLITEALARSQNTPAVQALAAVVDKIGEEAVVDYMNSIGFDFEYEDFDLQFAIGGNRCTVTPLQLAGAHAMFMNGGRYIKPHTIKYIRYVDGREDFVADTVGEQKLSEETAYMMAYMEYYNMYGDFSSLMWYCKRDYPLYGKTGTTDWADSGLEYGIPEGSTKDSWLVMQTNQYTISCWTGYDQLEEGAYFTNAEYQENTKSKLVSKILDELEEHAIGDYDPYRELERPEGVVDITHVKGAYPYCYPSGGYQTVTGMISQKALDENPLVSVSEVLSKLKTKVVSSFISSVGGTYDGENIWVSVGIAGSSTEQVGDYVDISETNAYNETTHAVGRSYFPHYYYVYSGEDISSFSFNIIVDGNIVASGTSSDVNMNFQASGSNASACVWTDDPEQQICGTMARQ